MLDHHLGHFEIGNHAVGQRPVGANIIRVLPDQDLGVASDRTDALHAVRDLNGDDGRLIDDDAFPGDVHQRVRRSKVDGDIPCPATGNDRNP